MSLHRRAARRDAVEKDIVAMLESCGWQVVRLSSKGAPDLLLSRAGRLVLAEVKAPNGRLTVEQIAWRQWWQGPAPVVLRSVEDVMQLANARV